MASSSEDEWIVVKCIDPEITAVRSAAADVILSTAVIHTWNLASLHARQIITIKAHRNRHLSLSLALSLPLPLSRSPSLAFSFKLNYNLCMHSG